MICADPENSARGSPENAFFFVVLSYMYQRISQRAVSTSLERQLNPRGPIASRGGLYQETYNHLWFSRGGGGGPGPCLHSPLDQPMNDDNFLLVMWFEF